MGVIFTFILTLFNPELVHSLVLTGSSICTKKFWEKPSQEEVIETISKRNRRSFLDPKVATDELVDEVFGGK